jgi:hypothetical protein
MQADASRVARATKACDKARSLSLAIHAVCTWCTCRLCTGHIERERTGQNVHLTLTDTPLQLLGAGSEVVHTVVRARDEEKRPRECVAASCRFISNAGAAAAVAASFHTSILW